MKKQVIWGTLLLLTIYSCQKKDNNDPENVKQENTTTPTSDKKTAFKAYITSLNSIPLPFLHTTNEEQKNSTFANISPNYDTAGFATFKTEQAVKPLGILQQNETFVSVVELAESAWDLIPILCVYDWNGNKIDSLSLYETTGDDMGYSAREYLNFKSESLIIKTDSITTWELTPDATDILEETQKTTSKSKKIHISPQGKIKVI
nr:hypothetical protein [uncultured Flavobacterium sp.]